MPDKMTLTLAEYEERYLKPACERLAAEFERANPDVMARARRNARRCKRYAERKNAARPSEYDPEVAREICEEIATSPRGSMAERERLIPDFVHRAAETIERRLTELGARPALEPVVQRLHSTGLTPAEHRQQLYVPYGRKPIPLTEEHVEHLALAVFEATSAPTFYRLQLPEAMASAVTSESRGCSVRYIEMYDIGWDAYRQRLDVLFDREDDVA